MSVQCDLFTTYNTLKLSFEILLLLTVSINIVKIYEWIGQVFIIRYNTCTHIALEHYNIPLYYLLQLRFEDGWQILHNSYIYTSFLNIYFSIFFKNFQEATYNVHVYWVWNVITSGTRNKLLSWTFVLRVRTRVHVPTSAGSRDHGIGSASSSAM